jgi:hypothetical protein
MAKRLYRATVTMEFYFLADDAQHPESTAMLHAREALTNMPDDIAEAERVRPGDPMLPEWTPDCLVYGAPYRANVTYAEALAASEAAE